MANWGKALADFGAGAATSYANTLREQETFELEERKARASDMRKMNMQRQKQKWESEEQAKQNDFTTGRDTAKYAQEDKNTVDRGEQSRLTQAEGSRLTEERQIRAEGRAAEARSDAHEMEIEQYFDKRQAILDDMKENGRSDEEINMVKLKSWGLDVKKGSFDTQEAKSDAWDIAVKQTKIANDSRDVPFTAEEAMGHTRQVAGLVYGDMAGAFNSISGKDVVKHATGKEIQATAEGKEEGGLTLGSALTKIDNMPTDADKLKYLESLPEKSRGQIVDALESKYGKEKKGRGIISIKEGSELDSWWKSYKENARGRAPSTKTSDEDY